MGIQSMKTFCIKTYGFFGHLQNPTNKNRGTGQESALHVEVNHLIDMSRLYGKRSVPLLFLMYNLSYALP